MKWIKKRARKQLTLLQRQLNAFQQAVDFDLLHDIRVEIKKLKAILRLLHTADKKFNDHKAFIPLRDLFRDCGKIREIQLTRHHLIEYSIPVELPPAIENDLAKEFRSKVTRHQKLLKQLRTTILKRTEKVRKSTYKKHMRKLKKKLVEKLSDKTRSADLHSVRKSVKELIFLLKKKENDTQADLLQQSAERIGQWNDKRNLIAFLAQNVPENKDTMARLKAEMNKDRRAITKLHTQLLQEL
jgi:hypothetical protein